MGHQRGNIDGEAGSQESLQVLPKGTPGKVQVPTLIKPDRIAFGQCLIARGRRTSPAIPGHNGGDALSYSALSLPIDDEREIRMAVNVDEARTNPLSGRIPGPFALDVRGTAHPGDFSVLDHDIAREGRGTSAVNDISTSNYQIDHPQLPSFRTDPVPLRPPARDCSQIQPAGHSFHTKSLKISCFNSSSTLAPVAIRQILRPRIESLASRAAASAAAPAPSTR